jgi:hypothetical protein
MLITVVQIPYATSRAEIIAVLGRNSKILSDYYEPIHIIMERVTSKTQDAYVEFRSLQDAVKAVERLQATGTGARNARLGERLLTVSLSSQSALMAALFPLAKGIFWNGAVPQIRAPVPGEPWKNFKGFVTPEEVAMLVKHVEIPSRVCLPPTVAIVHHD